MIHNRLRSSPLPRGLDRPAATRIFFNDELDAASGARNDCGGNPGRDNELTKSELRSQTASEVVALSVEPQIKVKPVATVADQVTP